jgi:hypothetical protein
MIQANYLKEHEDLEKDLPFEELVSGREESCGV